MSEDVLRTDVKLLPHEKHTHLWRRIVVLATASRVVIFVQAVVVVVVIVIRSDAVCFQVILVIVNTMGK